LGLVLLLGHVPVLNDARAADRGEPGWDMIAGAGGFGDVDEDRRHEVMEAVPAREYAQALWRRLGLPLVRPSDNDGEHEEDDRRQARARNHDGSEVCRVLHMLPDLL